MFNQTTVLHAMHMHELFSSISDNNTWKFLKVKFPHEFQEHKDDAQYLKRW